jgi:glycosyltransferase involved in cell wall biosynthesis
MTDRAMRLMFLGPATVHQVNWLNEFHRQGVDVELVTAHRPEAALGTFPVSDLSSRDAGRTQLVRCIPAIRRLIHDRKPSLVVAYNASSYGLAARLSGFRPYVVVTAGSDINLSLKRRSHLYPIVRYALAGAERVICWSPTMARAVGRFGVPDDRIVVQPRGVPLHRFGLSQQSAANSVFTLICIRRFSRIFHHETLIEACRRLASLSLPFQLYLCNGGPERVRIENLVSKYGLKDRVHFFREVDHDRVAELLQKTHVYVALPEMDGASASLFEAMSVGTYPVVSDIDANRVWIRDGINGRLVRFDDPEGLAQILKTLYENPDARSEAIRVNREMVEQRLDLVPNTRRFTEIFRQIDGSSGVTSSAREGTSFAADSGSSVR